MPGDWVLFDQHVEVVTGDSGGVLHTIGGDSLPNFSVNAHQYPGPLAAQGVAGFVNNGAAHHRRRDGRAFRRRRRAGPAADTAPSSGSGTARASQQGGATAWAPRCQLAAIPGSQEAPGR